MSARVFIFHMNIPFEGTKPFDLDIASPCKGIITDFTFDMSVNTKRYITDWKLQLKYCPIIQKYYDKFWSVNEQNNITNW